MCGINEVVQSNSIIAMGTASTRADPPAPEVADLASLLADVALPAAVALVDGVGLGHHWLDRSSPPATPRGLAAERGAVALSADGVKASPALPTGRRAIVAHGVHDATLAEARRVASYSAGLRKFSEEWSLRRLYQTSMYSKTARRTWARVAQL